MCVELDSAFADAAACRAQLFAEKHLQPFASELGFQRVLTREAVLEKTAEAMQHCLLSTTKSAVANGETGMVVASKLLKEVVGCQQPLPTRSRAHGATYTSASETESSASDATDDEDSMTR